MLQTSNTQTIGSLAMFNRATSASEPDKPMRILVTPKSLNAQRRLLDPVADRMEIVFGALSTPASTSATRDCEILILGNEVLDRETICSFPRLRIVIRFGAGTDNVDVSHLQHSGIKFFTCDNCAGEAIAEYVLSTTMFYGRGFAQFIQTGCERPDEVFIPKQPDEMVVGIIGLGSTGTATAVLLRKVGFNVTAYSRRRNEQFCDEHSVEQKTLDVLLAESDVVSLHISLTDETRGFLNKNRISELKRGATIINSARAEIVDEKAVFEQLETGHVANYVTDFPLIDTRCIGHPRVFSTPHIAGRSQSSVYRRASRVIDIISTFTKR